MEFIAIDVETANADMGSICQLGLAHFRDGALAGEWKTYVDPEDYFDPVNTSIHGIDEEVVKGAPTLAQVVEPIMQWLDGRVVVCHTHFDRVALRQALQRYGYEPPKCTWLDSARVTRRTCWSDCAQSGYGLHDVCERIGYDFQHHDALEDAKAAGYVLLTAMDTTGITLEEWLVRVERPINPDSPSGQPIVRSGNPEGDLFGEVLVFTGALEVPRHQAADLAAAVGCQVCDNVTKNTTLLVVGDQDVKKLAGHDKSSKHRRVEALIADGHSIRILRETDFKLLVAMASEGRS
jgi:DNA polymerase-3 subunit epsilon